LKKLKQTREPKK